MKIDFSVVIPLYNKAKEIIHTLEGVASQRYAPMEVIVVDDGSTDGGAELVEQMKAQLPTLQLIRRANGGVSVARNCGIVHARGNYIALLDADDFWKPEYLERVTGLIERYPGCGMYCMGFEVHRPEGVFPNETGMQEGVVANYFRTAMHVNLTQTSSVTIPRAVFEQLGGFPEGMKLGEDQYVWTKIARNYPICYSPQRYSEFNLMAQNRSAQNYTMEQTPYSFWEFYDPSTPDCNEFIARCEIGKALVHTIYGYTVAAREVERRYAYNRHYRLGWWKLWVLNRLPVAWRRPLLDLYKRVTWLISKKGLLG